MSTTCSSTIQNDISYTLVTTVGGQTQSETASLGYTQSLSNGLGSLQNNYGVTVSGNLAAGAVSYFNFEALSKEVFNASASINFSGIKSVAIQNTSTGNDLLVRATGSNALDEIFNGGTGNVRVKPYAVYSYSDPSTGAVVNSSNKNLQIKNAGSSTTAYQMIVVGVTG
tara:strand:- start:7131 stop:7637 length:507 start_codon:yes stop_codon:yes gene_type:complete